MSDASMSEEDIAHIFGTSPRAGAWQPIETAPIDVNVLAYSSKTEDMVVAHQFDSPIFGGKHWVVIGDQTSLWSGWVPTHWTPLPEPPSTYQEWD